jgi:hypothetical protein
MRKDALRGKAKADTTLAKSRNLIEARAQRFLRFFLSATSQNPLPRATCGVFFTSSRGPKSIPDGASAKARSFRSSSSSSYSATAQIGIKHEGKSTNENEAFHEKKMEKDHPVCPLPTHQQR